MKQLVAIALAALFLLAGCSGAVPSSSVAPSSLPQSSATAPGGTPTQLQAWNFPPTPHKELPITTLEYDFGQKKLESAPREVIYSVRGVLSLPNSTQNGPYPLVLILHGSHENIEEEARFDIGFTYLCEALAKNGYAVASLDLNVAYLWHLGENDLEKTIEMTHHHLTALREMAQNPTEEYALLQNNIDFDKIFLIGHSRGGGSIFEIADYEATNGNPISGLIGVAPALMQQRRDFVDIPSHILVPALDGDLTDLQGFYLSYAVRDSHQKSITSVTLLEQANHNFFNTVLVEQDRNDARWFGPVTDQQLTAPQQQEFLAEYSLTLLNNMVAKQQSFFGLHQHTPTTLFGKKASLIFYQPGRVPLLNIFDASRLRPSENTTAQTMVDSWFFKLDTAPFFDSITLGSEEFQTKDLLQIRWEQSIGGLEFTPTVQDFSGKTALFLEMALDSAQFETDPRILLSITLTDGAGHTQTVTLPQGEPALSFVPGEKEVLDIGDANFYAYSKKTPITGCWVPLENWSQLDVTQITAVTLEFASQENAPGAVMLEGCFLY